jgi:hypothetical protein
LNENAYSAIMPASEAAIMHNTQVKIYPDGVRVLVADRPIFRERGWEEQRRSAPAELPEGSEEGPRDPAARERESIERSKRRARAAVYDLARCTDFWYFVTLTTSAEKVDRLDDEAVFRKLHNWLDNHVRRSGLAYVLVPEYHKKGGLHFHAFFNGALPVIDSGTLSVPGVKKPRRPRSAAERRRLLDEGAHVVYNLPAWSLGFTTAIELYGSRSAAVGYVCKYITKAERKIGGRWYYSGGDLRRPDVQFADTDFRAAFDRCKADLDEKTKRARSDHAREKLEKMRPDFAIDELGCRCCRYEEE